MIDADLQAQLEIALTEREELKNESEIQKHRFERLIVQVEDAHAAVLGYQMDCANLSARTHELHALVTEVQQRCSDTREKIVSACREEVALKQTLENVAGRCKLFQECEEQLRTTGAVKNQATVRFLRCHLREAASRERNSTENKEQIRRRCTNLASKSAELVAKLMSACAAEGDSSTSAAGSCVKPRISPRLASTRRAPQIKTPPLQVRPSTASVMHAEIVVDARRSSGGSRPSASTDVENSYPSKCSRPPLPPARRPEATSEVSQSESSTACLLINADARCAELEANSRSLDDTVRGLEALQAKLCGLKDFLAEACREGAEPCAWSPGLPENIEASLSPLLEELRRYALPDYVDGNHQPHVSYRLNSLGTTSESSRVANGSDRSHA